MKAIDRFAFEPKTTRQSVIAIIYAGGERSLGAANMAVVCTMFYTLNHGVSIANCTTIPCLHANGLMPRFLALCCLPPKNKTCRIRYSIQMKYHAHTHTHISFSFFRSCCDRFGVNADVYLFTLHSHCFVFFRLVPKKSIHVRFSFVYSIVQ